MYNIFLSTITSVLVISFVSFAGLVTFYSKFKNKTILAALVSLSCGVLLGDVFLHLIPEVAAVGYDANVGLMILVGVVLFFILEKIVLAHHSHTEHDEHVHSAAWLSLYGDAIHNFIDGLIIAASFSVSFELGVASSIAIVLHEIPHEIGDFAIMIHGGWSVKKAALANFAVALTAVLGGVVGLMIHSASSSLSSILLPFAISSFLYLAMSDLIPALQKERSMRSALMHVLMIVVGILLMYLFVLIE